MKKERVFWNYIDLIMQAAIVLLSIVGFYMLAENLEKYIYRYTIFPFIAVVLIFLWGISLGKGIERTRHKKPVGLISKKMYKARKQKNLFIFSTDGETYAPHKEVIEEIKSGEIVHVKQFVENDFEIDEFDDIYTISIDDIVDMKMKDDEEKQ